MIEIDIPRNHVVVGLRGKLAGEKDKKRVPILSGKPKNDAFRLAQEVIETNCYPYTHFFDASDEELLDSDPNVSKESHALHSLLLAGLGERMTLRREQRSVTNSNQGFVFDVTVYPKNDKGDTLIDQGEPTFVPIDLEDLVHQPPECGKYELFNIASTLTWNALNDALIDHCEDLLSYASQNPTSWQSVALGRLEFLLKTDGPFQGLADPRFNALFVNGRSAALQLGRILRLIPEVCEDHGVNLTDDEGVGDLLIHVAESSTPFIHELALLDHTVSQKLFVERLTEIPNGPHWDTVTREKYCLALDKDGNIRLDMNDFNKRVSKYIAEKVTPQEHQGTRYGCPAERVLTTGLPGEIKPQSLVTTLWEMNLELARYFYPVYLDKCRGTST